MKFLWDLRSRDNSLGFSFPKFAKTQSVWLQILRMPDFALPEQNQAPKFLLRTKYVAEENRAIQNLLYPEPILNPISLAPKCLAVNIEEF